MNPNNTPRIQALDELLGVLSERSPAMETIWNRLWSQTNSKRPTQEEMTHLVRLGKEPKLQYFLNTVTLTCDYDYHPDAAALENEIKADPKELREILKAGAPPRKNQTARFREIQAAWRSAVDNGGNPPFHYGWGSGCGQKMIARPAQTDEREFWIGPEEADRVLKKCCKNEVDHGMLTKPLWIHGLGHICQITFGKNPEEGTLHASIASREETTPHSKFRIPATGLPALLASLKKALEAHKGMEEIHQGNTGGQFYSCLCGLWEPTRFGWQWWTQVGTAKYRVSEEALIQVPLLAKGSRILWCATTEDLKKMEAELVELAGQLGARIAK